MADIRGKITVIPFRPEGKLRVFANYVRIVSNPSEVNLQFCDVKPPANDEERENLKDDLKIIVPIDTEIILPVSVAEKLSNILKEQLNLIKSNGRKG